GAINVIPGEVEFTIDIRAPRDELRTQAVMDTLAEVNTIAKRRRLACELELIQELGVTACAPWLMRQLESAIDRQGVRIRRLPSGAGHDGQAMSAISDVAMLFVRCRGGIR